MGKEKGLTLGDCVSNASNVMGDLEGFGRPIWVSNIGHMYVLDMRAEDGSEAINLPVQNSFGGVVYRKKHKNYTKGELLRMLETGEAEDFTELMSS